MSIKALIRIDDDRWAKHPYSIEFDDDDCNSQFRKDSLNNRQACYRIIEQAKAAGFDIDPNVEEEFY